MLIEKMTTKECEDFLQRTPFGRLGCAADNEPYIVPTYFAYERDYVYGFATPGRKIESMRSNPKVCIEADEVTNIFQWTSVIANGQFEEFPDRPEFKEKRLNAQ